MQNKIPTFFVRFFGLLGNSLSPQITWEDLRYKLEDNLVSNYLGGFKV